MIELVPEVNVEYDCPKCSSALEPTDWLIPGYRVLGRFECSGCGTTFLGDLPVGHGTMFPVLLETSTGETYGAEEYSWFANALQHSYENRESRKAPVSYDRGEVSTPLVLNSLDTIYGHSLLKLLNCDYYHQQYPSLDLLVIVPKSLEWLVPEYVEEVWTVDATFEEQGRYNEWLADEFHNQLYDYSTVYVADAFPSPNPDDIVIENYTGIVPFQRERWDHTDPTITFIWREGRYWGDRPYLLKKVAGIARRIKDQGIHSPQKRVQSFQAHYLRRQQRDKIVSLGQQLRHRYDNVDFSVAGIGTAESFPAWIRDLRFDSPTPSQERSLCEQYAKSHVVVGMHGSNMLLPSAHAGAVVEFMPSGRWGNLFQDLLPRASGARETLLYYRVLPDETDPETAAAVISSVLEDRENLERHISRERLSPVGPDEFIE